MDIREVEWGGMHLIRQAHDRDEGRGLVYTVLIL
jgi:hypothetical protein